MRGRAIGQVRDSHVHQLSSQYVGELYDDMVVDNHLGNLGNIGNPGNPGNPWEPGKSGQTELPEWFWAIRGWYAS
jgi:hypothetical protein